MSDHLFYRRLAQAAEWSLLAIVVLLHVAGWFWSKRLVESGPIGAFVADSLPYASLALAGLWIALGPGPRWLRGACLLTYGAAHYAIASGSGPTNNSISDGHLAATGAVTLLAAIILRITGRRLRCQNSNSPGSGGKTFSIRSLLVITTAIALLIGGLEAVRPWLAQDRELDEFLEPLLAEDTSGIDVAIPIRAPVVPQFAADAPWDDVVRYLRARELHWKHRSILAAGVFALASLLAFAAMMGPGAVYLRLGGLAAAIPAAGWYVGHLTNAGPEYSINLTLWMATVVLMFTASLVPLRLMGYRLMRPQHALSEAKP